MDPCRASRKENQVFHVHEPFRFAAAREGTIFLHAVSVTRKKSTGSKNHRNLSECSSSIALSRQGCRRQDLRCRKRKPPVRHQSRPTDSHNLISNQAGNRCRPLRPDGNRSPLPFSTKISGSPVKAHRKQASPSLILGFLDLQN